MKQRYLLLDYLQAVDYMGEDWFKNESLPVCTDGKSVSYFVPEVRVLKKEYENTDDDLISWYYVDLPLDSTLDEWTNVARFKTRHEAIAFANLEYGADENGCISLIRQ